MREEIEIKRLRARNRMRALTLCRREWKIGSRLITWDCRMNDHHDAVVVGYMGKNKFRMVIEMKYGGETWRTTMNRDDFHLRPTTEHYQRNVKLLNNFK